MRSIVDEGREGAGAMVERRVRGRDTGRPGVAVVVTAALVAAILSIVSASSAASVGSIIYVDIAAAGADDGSSWADAFIDVQDALAVATAGDEIRVAEGTYRPHLSDRDVSFEMVDEVNLTGGFATGGVAGPDPTAYPTILSGDLAGDDLPGGLNMAENTRRVVMAGEKILFSVDVVISGFTITGGNADGFGQFGRGAGISMFGGDVRLVDTKIVGNRAISGAGVYANEGDPHFTRTVVAGNTALDFGGGILLDEVGAALFKAKLIDSVVAYNSAGNGGGGMLFSEESEGVVTGSTFMFNAAATGGAIFANNFSTMDIVDSVLSFNSATGDGGGLTIADSDITIVNSRITNNLASLAGGGVHAQNGGGLDLVNTLVTDNHAGGAGGGISSDDATSTVVNSVVAANGHGPGSGQIDNADFSSLGVVNSIVWSSTPGSAGIADDATSTSTVDHSDVVGWTGAGVGNIDVDPLFVGPGNYRLQRTSPAREAGDNAAVVPDTFDVDGDGNTTEPTPDVDGRDRIAGVVDMGAYEVPLVSISPFGFVAAEGDTGSVTYQLPVTLSQAEAVPVTIDWNTVDAFPNPQVAQAGSDFVSASGTLTFLPGETVKNVEIEILGDTVDEPPLLYGEWGLVQFSNPSFGVLTGGLFGLGLFIIIDDDP